MGNSPGTTHLLPSTSDREVKLHMPSIQLISPSKPVPLPSSALGGDTCGVPGPSQELEVGPDSCHVATYSFIQSRPGPVGLPARTDLLGALQDCCLPPHSLAGSSLLLFHQPAHSSSGGLPKSPLPVFPPPEERRPPLPPVKLL